MGRGVVGVVGGGGRERERERGGDEESSWILLPAYVGS